MLWKKSSTQNKSSAIKISGRTVYAAWWWFTDCKRIYNTFEKREHKIEPFCLNIVVLWCDVAFSTAPNSQLSYKAAWKSFSQFRVLFLPSFSLHLLSSFRAVFPLFPGKSGNKIVFNTLPKCRAVSSSFHSHRFNQVNCTLFRRWEWKKKRQVFPFTNFLTVLNTIFAGK